MWIALELGLQKSKTIDKHVQEQINKEQQRVIEIMDSVMDGVMYLAKNSLAFRGGSDKIYTRNNGNFLSLMEVIAKHDPVLNIHLRRIVKKETHYHYLSHKLQNELITMVADKIKSSIVEKIRNAKYYSIILDFTPDRSHEDQMYIVVRCVDVSQVPAKVEEFFLGFLNVDDSTGECLFSELEDVLEKLILNIDDIRGQGYDNGSNMKGKEKERRVRKRKRHFDDDPSEETVSLPVCDNKPTISLTKNLVLHGRSKHIDIKYHYIRELVSNKEIDVEFVESEEQVADIFTKSLKANTFIYLRGKLGMISKEYLVLREDVEE
ncbi:zinc finger MYM-type protein 1-like [Papaver somniferum]|uniref:zinc finger MYM-type protein 1-like n=1 Tax=Papaver somniferum TaxID=3469 RepID=UPI000E702FAA|nr:zinc finger MYM-type protein 1-like [Papaver somniferum]